MVWWSDINSWNENRVRIKKKLLINNVKYFRFWSVIRKTMIVINPFVLIPEMLELIGNIHQKYHLLQLTRNTDIDFKELDSVVEIGGGYGAMCVSLYDKGFNGKYILFDFPEMIELQKYYLHKRNLNKEIKYTPNVMDINKQGGKSLLVALWSLGEMPLGLRLRINSKLLGFDYYLFAFKEYFNGIDNKEYFENLTRQIGGKWIIKKIEHIKECNYYLTKS